MLLLHLSLVIAWVWPMDLKLSTLFSLDCVLHVHNYLPKNYTKSDIAELLIFQPEIIRTVYTSMTEQIEPSHLYTEKCALHFPLLKETDEKRLEANLSKSVYKRNPLYQAIMLVSRAKNANLHSSTADILL